MSLLLMGRSLEAIKRVADILLFGYWLAVQSKGPGIGCADLGLQADFST